jgi:hypothetical protein
MPAGKPRYSWENEWRKDVVGLLRTNNWLVAAKYSDDWREKTANAVARKGPESHWKKDGGKPR